MRTRIALAVVLLAGLGGCATSHYQAGDSYAHTRMLAYARDADAQLMLARMYADPAHWPEMQGRKPQPVLAAKWCKIFARGGLPARPEVAAAGPSCAQILARLPPALVAEGEGLAGDFGQEPSWWLLSR